MSLTKEQIQDCRWILKALTEDQTKRPNKSPTEPTLKQPEWQNRVDALCDLALERLAMEPLNHLAKECHVANQTWWHDPKTGERCGAA